MPYRITLFYMNVQFTNHIHLEGWMTKLTEGECVWDLDHDLAMSDGSKARIDPTGNKTLDWISEDAEARAELYLDV